MRGVCYGCVLRVGGSLDSWGDCVWGCSSAPLFGNKISRWLDGGVFLGLSV